jgi:hypothetical protein
VHYEAGSLRDLVQSIYDAVMGAGTGSVNSTFGVKDAELDNDQTFGVLVTDLSGAVVLATAITPGTVSIRRIRANVNTEIVAATASSEAAGRIYYTYGFPNASWQVGDIFYLIFSGIVITTAGDTFTYPDIYYWGRVTSEEATYTVVLDNQSKLTSATFGLSALKTLIDTIDTVADGIDTVVDGLATSLADGTNGLAAIKTAVNARAIPTDITTAHSTTDGLVNGVKGVVDAIKLQTDGLHFTEDDVKATLDGETVTASSVTDKAGYSISGTKQTLDALNDLSAASMNAEVDTALNTAVPASPTAGSLNDILSKAAGGNTFDKTTDSLEALRDYLVAIQNGTNTLQTIFDKTQKTIKRSAQSGSLLMDGTEQTVYEESDTVAFELVGGTIYLPGVASGSTTLKLYQKIENGGSYILISTVSQAHTASISIPVDYITSAIPGWRIFSVYGIKITLTQTAGVNQTHEFEFFDTK